MLNEKEISNKCKEFCKQYFDVDFNEKIRISGRMTATAAKVTFKKQTIGNECFLSIVDLCFAKNVFQNPHYTIDELESIIKHELAHFYIIKFKQMDCGHNDYFKSVCLSIGGDLGYANGNIKTKTEKYIVVCSECGNVVASRSRVPSDKLMLNNISSCCKAKLFNMGKVDLGATTNIQIKSNYLSDYKMAAIKNS